jgi:hypothetical protein
MDINLSQDEVYCIGIRDHQWHWLLAIHALLLFGGSSTFPLGLSILGVELILYAVWTYRLARLINMPKTWLWGCISLLPIVNIIPMILISKHASTILKHAGLKVGFMGPNNKQLRTLAPIPKHTGVRFVMVHSWWLLGTAGLIKVVSHFIATADINATSGYHYVSIVIGFVSYVGIFALISFLIARFLKRQVFEAVFVSLFCGACLCDILGALVNRVVPIIISTM